MRDAFPDPVRKLLRLLGTSLNFDHDQVVACWGQDPKDRPPIASVVIVLRQVCKDKGIAYNEDGGKHGAF